MHVKYHNSYFWENLIRTRKLLETFNQEQIREQSLFFHGIIYNSVGRRKLLEDVIHFTSGDALSGYLYYVFLPTVFLSFTNDEKGIIVPLGLPLPELVGYVSNNDFVRYHNYVEPMLRLTEQCEMAMHSQGDEQLQALRRMVGVFNFSFQLDRDAYAMMQIYSSPQELGAYFSNLYQIEGNKNLGTELFYHKTGLRKAEWEDLCHNAGNNIFFSRKFMNCIGQLLHTI